MRTVHLFVLSALFLGSGAMVGLWTCRWTATTPPLDIAKILEFDRPIGDWQIGESIALSSDEIPEKTQVTTREFHNVSGTQSMIVSLAGGLPGIVSVHTPDVCYVGTGFKLASAIKKETILLSDGKTNATFYRADFEKPLHSGTERIRVRWGWTMDGNWSAPDSPRFEYAKLSLGKLRYLYKIYLVHPLDDEEDITPDNSHNQFISRLLPRIQGYFQQN